MHLRWDLFEAGMRARELSSVAAQARELGVPDSTLFRIRNGTFRPSLDLAASMAEAANLSLDVLVGLRPPDPETADGQVAQ